MKPTSKTTSIVILGILALVFGYDTLAVAFGWHASISECVTNGLQGRIVWSLAMVVIGILIGHWVFSVNYNKP